MRRSHPRLYRKMHVTTIQLAMMRLLVLNGTERETTVPLDRANVLIGRDKTCDLCLRDAYVSRHHCWVERQDDSWYVRDLGSRNGTWVNGARVTQPTEVESGAVLKVGRTLMRVEETTESTETSYQPPWPTLDLDFTHKTARLDDQLVLPPLTDAQWKALVLLWERRGRAVTREEIAANVWPELSRQDASRHVDRLMERIRMRLGDVEAVLIQPSADGYLLPE